MIRAIAAPIIVTRFLVVRLGKQLEHLDIDGSKSIQLPDDASPHEAGKSGWGRRIVSLLVRFFVGDIAHVLFLVNWLLISPAGKTSPDAVLPDR
jgi:hypothetical protein